MGLMLAVLVDIEGKFHSLRGRKGQIGDKLSKSHGDGCCMKCAKYYMLKKTRICFEREGRKDWKSEGFGFVKGNGKWSTGIIRIRNSFDLCWREGIMY